ncbi:hypothetical protein SAMN06296020_10568 [Anoxynatronum buryatiense]|uniref:Uncharacterized protein n=1 Tax=Anoxynatronum buryatiense TaxID=489973 RepID=A0AA46AIS1_9CLOT|nr:hypothetical protein SAMN06296020_10568 [Anoxynatronum buryatiense]
MVETNETYETNETNYETNNETSFNQMFQDGH